MDWKDTLASLKGGMPEEENPEISTPNDITADGKEKPGKKEKLNIVMERKGRKGKTATIIEGFLCSDEELEEIARQLKQKIGTGGSARGGEILLQGDWRDKAKEILKGLGFRI